MSPPIHMLTSFRPREGVYLDALAGSLGSGWSLIELVGPTDGQPLRGPDEWIDHYRRQIESLSGPPEILLGYSWGGILALELACWLRSAGSPPSWVGMIDTWRRSTRYPRTVGEKFMTTLAEFGTRPPGQRMRYLDQQVRRIASYRWGLVAGRTTSLWRTPDRLKLEAKPEPETPSEALMRAVRRGWVKYAVHSVDFHVSLFTCETSARRFDGDPSLGWAPYLLGGFDTTRIEGEHLTLFDSDHIGSLAGALNRSLERAGFRGGLVEATDSDTPIGHHSGSTPGEERASNPSASSP